MKTLARFVASASLIAFGVGAAVGLGATLVESAPAGAVTSITVNDASDPGSPTLGNCLSAPETDCSLRAALDAAAEEGGVVNISLPDPSTVPNNPSAPGGSYIVDPANGELVLNEPGAAVTVTGAGASVSKVDAQCGAEEADCTDNIRVLDLVNGALTLSGVTIEGGDPDSNSDPSPGDGGGILDQGTLTLTSSSVTGNTATEAGGGIYLATGASATLDSATVSDNQQTDAESGLGGGGIYLEGNEEEAANLTIEDGSTVADNTSEENGAGVELAGQDNLAGTTVTIDDSTISDNTVLAELFNGGGLSQDALGTLTVTGSTITGNATQTVVGEGETAQFGGGVNLQATGGIASFTGDTISDNTSVIGGGVSMTVEADPTFTDDTVSGNTATYGAGGFYIGVAETDPVDISGSTINGNNAAGTATIPDSDDGTGAGIVADGCHTLDLTNDTITGNSAENNGGGFLGVDCSLELSGEHASTPSAAGPFVPHETQAAPAPRITPSSTTAFLFDTITGNSAGSPTDSAGNIWQADDSFITLANTIVSGGIVGTSPTTNCLLTDPSTFSSSGYNLIDDSTCGTPGTGDIIGQSPQLGSLGDNGGPTQTEVPGTGSPAISAVPASVCSATAVSTDQRGNARGAGANGSCTIGAVEVAQATPPSFNPNGYRLVADEGGIFDFGLNFNGSLVTYRLNAPIVGIANSPGPNGYLMVGSDGGVFALGGANFYGSLAATPLPSPIAAIAATPAEDGYWLVSQSGTISHFGNTPALPALSLPSGAHIVGMASDNTGRGAWLVDQRGDVYAEGDALYEGGLGGTHLNAPIVGIAAAAVGQGYVLVASDGGVFNYKMGFYGSVPGSLKAGQSLIAPIVGIAVTHSGNGYWEVGADGGVFNYGDAPFLGSIYTAIPGRHLNGPIVGVQHLGSPPPG